MNYNNICDILICEKELFIGRMIFRMIKNFEIKNLTYFLCFRETSIDIANIEYVFWSICEKELFIIGRMIFQKFWKSNLFSLFSWNDRYREYRIRFFERSIDEYNETTHFRLWKKLWISI